MEKSWFDTFKKTGKLLVVDSGFTTGSVAGEIIANLTINYFNLFKSMILSKNLSVSSL